MIVLSLRFLSFLFWWSVMFERDLEVLVGWQSRSDGSILDLQG
jgi:hypothetical protein